MASDIENLTTFYANLPSIFETDPSTSIEHSSDATVRIIDSEKTYQPMFGSFLFADSEPFTRAAFVAPVSSSIEVKPKEEQRIDEASVLEDNNIQTMKSSPLALVEEDISDMDDDDDNNDDEDDFDGIPIRHASSMIKEKLNGDNHSFINHSEHNNLLDNFVHRIENDDDDDDDEELFLNGFIDEQQQQHDTIPIPSLFNNIPDIDDLNEHEEEGDDRIPFDHMDMLDQSDSIRSSSPDSVLSSSHLRDDDDDDDDEEMHNNDDEDDVTQWNDDYLLGKITLQSDRPNAPLPPPIVLNIHPHDQVDFIDTSRSHSRCSNASSRLSIGYADQAQIFLNDDDGLVTSSDSESDHEHDDNDADKINYENDLLTHDNSEEPTLQVNFNYHRSRSSSYSSPSQNNSPRSLSPVIPDQSPIIPIDDDINETKTNIPSAPIAIVDDDNDDDDDDDLLKFTSDQPVLSPIPLKNHSELRNENRQTDIVHDIINIRHILNEHDNDDEFIAIMHNPTVFEDVLYDNDNQQKSDLFKQTNVVTNTFQASAQLSNNNKTECESFEHYQNIQEISSLSISNNEKNSPSNITTTNGSSPTAVNHLPIEKDEEKKENTDVVNRSRIELKKTQQSQDKNTTNINIKQITNSGEEQRDHYQMMSSDSESDNDSELLKTLAQFHGLVHTSRLSSEINQTEILKNKIQQYDDEEQMKNLNIDEKQNIIFSNNNDKNQKKNEEKKSSTSFSSTSLTSSALFNDDESHSIDIIFDSDASSSLIMSNNDLQTIGKENNESELSILSTVDIEVISIVEKLVSDTLQLAINEFNQLIENFVEQIISEVIYEIYHEDKNLFESNLNESLSTENLALIISWHQNPPNQQLYDPFDQKFHSVWMNHFQTPDDIINDSFYSNTFDQSNLFSSTTSNQVNSTLLINPFDSTITANDLIKYSLTTSVKNINTNNNDVFNLFTNESSITTDDNINNESKNLSSFENQDDTEISSTIQINENEPSKHENFYENQPRLSQFDESLQIQKSTGDENEPWELEDSNEEKLKPIPTIITQKHDSYNNFSSDANRSTIASTPPSTDEENNNEIENENDNYDNYFSKYQTTENTESIEIPSPKVVRFDDNLQNVNIITPKDSLNQSESSNTTSDSDETDDEHTTPNLRTLNDHRNEKEARDNETTEVIMRNSNPRPESNISLTESEDLPPPLPPLPPLNNKPTTTNDNIPLKSTLTSSSSNLDSKRKTNLRSQSENTPINQTTTDTRLYNNTDSKLLQSNDSGIVIFIICIYSS